MKTKKSIIFLANASSPHVRHWVEYLEEMDVSYHIYSIHKNTFFADDKVTVKYNFLTKFGGGASLAYFFLGLWLRFFIRKSILHAHNTSGYGLSALLSGKPYIVTTYGTEIFGANKRSFLYRAIIKKVLKNANIITATSIAMKNTLEEEFCVEKKRIETFSLGVSSNFNFSLDMRVKIRADLGIPSDAIIWIYNRRITPLYNTLEVIDAFKKFKQGDANKHLILMEGDKDITYIELVKKEIKDDVNIHLVKGFLDQNMMSAYLSAADIAISLPKSDQLSSSILESISCGCLPMLANLPTYHPIFETITSVPVSFDNVIKGFYESNDLIAKLGNKFRFKILNEYAMTTWDRSNTISIIQEIYRFD